MTLSPELTAKIETIARKVQHEDWSVESGMAAIAEAAIREERQRWAAAIGDGYRYTSDRQGVVECPVCQCEVDERAAEALEWHAPDCLYRLAKEGT